MCEVTDRIERTPKEQRKALELIVLGEECRRTIREILADVRAALPGSPEQGEDDERVIRHA